MAISESGRLINELRDAGVNMESIGQAIGRNRSLVRQVSVGSKPGNNLQRSLEQLRDRLAGLDVGKPAANTAARSAAVAQPERRQQSLRRRTTHQGRSYSTSTVKRQAVQHGARSLGRPLDQAAEAGRQVAVTVSFNRRVTVNTTSGGRRGQTGAGGSLDMKLGDAEQVRAEVDAMHGGSLVQYVAAQAAERGHVSGPGDERDIALAITAMEFRAF